MTKSKYLELQKILKIDAGIDIEKSQSIMNALYRLEKRIQQETEDYYLPYSPLERVVRKLDRINKEMEELERTSNQ